MPATTSGRRTTSKVARPISTRRKFRAGAFVFAALAALGCKDSTDPSGSCDNIQNISLGVPVEGTLSSGDCRLAVDNSFADYYRLVVTSTVEVQIDLTSTDFDAYVYLNTTVDNSIDEDNDGGDGDDNARLTVTLTPGTYHILANSFLEGETGAYELTVAIVL